MIDQGLRIDTMLPKSQTITFSSTTKDLKLVVSETFYVTVLLQEKKNLLINNIYFFF